MLVRHDRPRNVNWRLAGGMLFGDVGTSRLYVLGLAGFYAGTAAPFYVGAVCLVLLLVAWGYTVVCRASPDGGGVYSSARHLNPTLGVIGATLLFTDYIVTAALSGYDAMIYFGVPRGWAPPATIVALAGIGVLNYVGPRRAGTFALCVAILSVTLTAVLGGFTIPHLADGVRAIHLPEASPVNQWTKFVAVVLALSGIEAVANMTGIMVPPVKRTSRLAIWPVVTEVVVLNMLLVVALCSVAALPRHGNLADRAAARAHWEKLSPAERELTPAPPPLTEEEHDLTERSLYVLAHQYVGPWFALVASVVFALLLLSASNTAVLGMVNIQYSMSRDRELPELFSRVNSFGVPWYGLFAACLLPSAVVVLAGNIQNLADMYAIGVVGAICLNLGCTAWNPAFDIKRVQRVALWCIAGLLAAIWLTIAVTKLKALTFLLIILSGAMVLRFVVRRFPARAPVPAPVPEAAPGLVPLDQLPPAPAFDPARGRILVASRGATNLVRFAFDEAQKRGSNLFVLFVRQITVLYGGDERPFTVEEDPEAAALFANCERMARELQVPFQPIFCVSPDPAWVILDFAATYAVDIVILGVSRRLGVVRALRGDVIASVADNLPPESTLLIHA